MMWISWGFDAARLGALTCTLTETGGGAATGAISMSGQYVHHVAHGDYRTSDPQTGDAEDGSTGYENFARALEDALNAVGNATYRVVFDPATPSYTISASGGSVTAFALTSISTSMQRVLGINVTSLSGALSYVNTSYSAGLTRPIWQWSAIDIGVSEWQQQEGDVGGEELVGADGEVRGLVALGATQPVDFVIPWEMGAKVWSDVGGHGEWTWQRALARARTIEPFWLCRDPRTSAARVVVGRLRQDGCTLRPRLASSDYLGHQSVPLGAHILGRTQHIGEAKASPVLWLEHRARVTLGTSPEVATHGDLSGYRNDAAQGTASLRPDQTDEGIVFDGSTHYMLVPDSSSLDVTTATTIAMRIRLDSLTGARGVIAKSTNASGSWSVQYNSELRLWFGNPGVNGGAAPSSAFAAGAWRTVIIVFDGAATGNANRLRMWVDGTQQTLTFYGTVPSTITADANQVGIGAFNNGTQPTAAAFRGIAQWASAASSSEVVAINSYMGAL